MGDAADGMDYTIANGQRPEREILLLLAGLYAAGALLSSSQRPTR